VDLCRRTFEGSCRSAEKPYIRLPHSLPILDNTSEDEHDEEPDTITDAAAHRVVTDEEASDEDEVDTDADDNHDEGDARWWWTFFR
jgi:hypothetical protein